MFPRTTTLNLDKISGRKNRAHQAEIQDIRAIVTGCHHAHRHANPGFAGSVHRIEITGTTEVIIGKVDGHLLCIRNQRRYLQPQSLNCNDLGTAYRPVRSGFGSVWQRGFD